MNRSKTFLVDGIRAYRFIGVLIIVIGSMLFGAGFSMEKLGKLAKARYEKSSGKLLRKFSTEDRLYYAYTQKSVRFGRTMKATSFAISLLGLIILIKPQLLFYCMNYSQKRKLRKNIIL